MTRDKAIKYAKILKTLIEIGEVTIILNTFIKAMKERSILKTNGVYYLHGNFNLGGTVSGRLSSSKPNMQNIPSTGSPYAKDIKACFQAPSGWVMAGADFNSLEDRISALTTKDPNKLKVYLEGYDGHCLRAYYYYKDELIGITDDVKSINSIKKKYPHLRQESKAPTFALTYQGTFKTLMNNCGFSEKKAKRIEFNYHELYKVSDDWVKDKMLKASKVGYTTVAFGLRVRTPILSQTILGTKSTPYEALAEGRTMGNAHGQSYGMLNNRAAIELLERLLDSPYAEWIKPSMHIHDATYYTVRDDLNTIAWLNKNLTECMQWQNLPEIKHPDVKLSGQLSIFYPDWRNDMSIPITAGPQEIKEVINFKLNEYYENQKTS